MYGAVVAAKALMDATPLSKLRAWEASRTRASQREGGLSLTLVDEEERAVKAVPNAQERAAAAETAAPTKPDAAAELAAAKSAGQCAKNAWCTRGFNHNGWGGRCSGTAKVRPLRGPIEAPIEAPIEPMTYKPCQLDAQCVRGADHGGRPGLCILARQHDVARPEERAARAERAERRSADAPSVDERVTDDEEGADAVCVRLSGCFATAGCESAMLAGSGAADWSTPMELDGPPGCEPSFGDELGVGGHTPWYKACRALVARVDESDGEGDDGVDSASVGAKFAAALGLCEVDADECAIESDGPSSSMAHLFSSVDSSRTQLFSSLDSSLDSTSIVHDSAGSSTYSWSQGGSSSEHDASVIDGHSSSGGLSSGGLSVTMMSGSMSVTDSHSDGGTLSSHGAASPEHEQPTSACNPSASFANLDDMAEQVFDALSAQDEDSAIGSLRAPWTTQAPWSHPATSSTPPPALVRDRETSRHEPLPLTSTRALSATHAAPLARPNGAATPATAAPVAATPCALAHPMSMPAHGCSAHFVQQVATLPYEQVCHNQQLVARLIWALPRATAIPLPPGTRCDFPRADLRQMPFEIPPPPAEALTRSAHQWANKKLRVIAPESSTHHMERRASSSRHAQPLQPAQASPTTPTTASVTSYTSDWQGVWSSQTAAPPSAAPAGKWRQRAALKEKAERQDDEKTGDADTDAAPAVRAPKLPHEADGYTLHLSDRSNSGYKGVSYRTRGVSRFEIPKPYFAYGPPPEQKYLGAFATAVEAAVAHAKYVKKAEATPASSRPRNEITADVQAVGQCAKNAWCTRGLNHNGWGGRCSGTAKALPERVWPHADKEGGAGGMKRKMAPDEDGKGEAEGQWEEEATAAEQQAAEAAEEGPTVASAYARNWALSVALSHEADVSVESAFLACMARSRKGGFARLSSLERALVESFKVLLWGYVADCSRLSTRSLKMDAAYDEAARAELHTTKDDSVQRASERRAAAGSRHAAAAHAADDDGDEAINLTDGLVVDGYDFLVKHFAAPAVGLPELDVSYGVAARTVEHDQTGVTIRLAKQTHGTPTRDKQTRDKQARAAQAASEQPGGGALAIEDDDAIMDDSEAEEEVLRADYVIIAVPLGVLQRSAADGGMSFSPPLSAKKRHAIDSLGMGTENKVALRWSAADVFWPADVPYLQMSDPRFRLMNAHYFGKRGVLVVLVAPPYADQMEKLDDATILDELLALLRMAFAPHLTALPPPIEHHITRWGQDPYSFGAYSYDKLGCVPGHRADLRAAETPAGSSVPRLFFAGEACSGDATQCVHGAVDTGREAAAELLRSIGLDECRWLPTVGAALNRGALVCKCRAVYDPRREMVECDTCGATFHKECVGVPLSEREDDGGGDGGGRKARRFRCMSCAPIPDIET